LLAADGRGTVAGVERRPVRRRCLVTGAALSALLAAGAGARVEARLPARLIVACAPKVQCTDRTKRLHRVQIGVSYTLQLPVGEPISLTSGKRTAIRRALRFRTREIRPKESDRVVGWAEVALSPSSAVGGFVGTRTLRLQDVGKRVDPVACTFDLTVCSDDRLAALGVSPARRTKLCSRALRRLRRRLGIIGVATAPVTFTVDRCPAPRPPRTTTTTSSTTSTSTSSGPTSSSTSTTTMP
jgi:hypothetical protein